MTVGKAARGVERKWKDPKNLEREKEKAVKWQEVRRA
jgi:hypothetical protein